MRHREHKPIPLDNSTYYVYNIDAIISNLETFIAINGNVIDCKGRRGHPKLLSQTLTISTKTYHNWENYGVIDSLKSLMVGSGYRYDASIILEQLKKHKSKQLSGEITQHRK